MKLRTTLRAVGIATVAIATAATLQACSPSGGDSNTVTLRIESWRNDDLQIWKTKIIPAFEADNPGIKIDFAPTQQTQYDTTLPTKLETEQAGDIVGCRAFSVTRNLYKRGFISDISDLKGLENFSEQALSGFTSDGKTYCVPATSVISGFFYNKNIFDELGIEVPTTMDEFMKDLETIQASDYDPIMMAAADTWTTEEFGYDNIGPNFYKGQQGLDALISGQAKWTDPEFVAPFEEFHKWEPYLEPNYEGVTYNDALTAFTQGNAAIYPGGSWDIGPILAASDFEAGWFAPPVQTAGDACYYIDHPDQGFGINSKTEHPEEARKFLEWIATSDFAALYTSAIPGFFTLQNESVPAANDLAAEVLAVRDSCEGSPRPYSQVLATADPNQETVLYDAASSALKGTKTPQEAAQMMQDSLDQAGYDPAKADDYR